MIGKIWRGFKKLHVMLYLLVFWMLGLGSITSGDPEKALRSLLDALGSRAR